MEVNSTPFFAVKSWEDGILGAFIRRPLNREMDHAKLLKNKASKPCFFLPVYSARRRFYPSPVTLP